MKALASLAIVCLVLILVLTLNATILLPQDAAPQVHPGKRAFLRNGCTQCHSVGAGTVVGPDLKGASAKYDQATLALWPQDSHVVYQKLGRKPANGGFPVMPILRTSEPDAREIAAFLVSVGKQGNEPQQAGAADETIVAGRGCRGHGRCGQGRQCGQQRCNGACDQCRCGRRG